MKTFRSIQAFISYNKNMVAACYLTRAIRYSSLTESVYQDRIQKRKGNILWSMVYFQIGNYCY